MTRSRGRKALKGPALRAHANGRPLTLMGDPFANHSSFVRTASPTLIAPRQTLDDPAPVTPRPDGGYPLAAPGKTKMI